jgi:hypothetical protein
MTFVNQGRISSSSNWKIEKPGAKKENSRREGPADLQANRRERRFEEP